MSKILLIEDNDEVRENIEEILSLSDYDVCSAPNGLIGVEKALKESPDLIICDVMMPELDGYGVLHILGKKPQTCDIPFIFLTAKADKADFRTGMNLGADDYLTKPFEHTELLNAVERRLKKSARYRNALKEEQAVHKTLIDEERGQKELEELATGREKHLFSKKSAIYLEGKHPNYLYYIAKGKVKTYHTNEYGKEYITGIYNAGTFLGYQALIQDAPYHESAVAIEAAEISYIPKVEFLKLLQNSRDFVAYFIKMLADQVTDKEEQLLNLAYHSIRKRVAEALMVLHQRFEAAGESKIDILRDDLASMVGTAKESISRMLTDFKSDQLIDIDPHGAITILDKEGLEQMPN